MELSHTSLRIVFMLREALTPRMHRRLLATTTALALTLLSAPALAGGLAAGAGQATFPGCPPGSEKLVPIAGAELPAGGWLFTVGNADSAGACTRAFADAYGGAFSPATGGCLFGRTADTLCFTFTRMTGATFEYDVTSNRLGAGAASLVIGYVG